MRMREKGKQEERCSEDAVTWNSFGVVTASRVIVCAGNTLWHHAHPV